MIPNLKQRSRGTIKPEPTPSPAATSAIRIANDESETTPSEDELASWLHCPIEDNSLETYLYTNDLLYPSPMFYAPATVAPTHLPPPPPPPSIILPSRSSKITPELHSSTVVASNATPPPPAGTPESRASRVSDKPAAVCVGNGGIGTAGREMDTCEMSVSLTSSSGTSGSGGSDRMEPTSFHKLRQSTADRKRKQKDTDDTEMHTEKQPHGGSTSTKKLRSAEVHNLSERRRRDRINEKMKALQELIPRCNKSDKASILDDAIEYLKSLQMQVQMMSTGSSMVPMMFLGAQHYMPPMAAMGMGMNHAMFPCPPILPGPSLANPAMAPATSAAHLGQCYPVSGFNMTPVTVGGSTSSQAANLSAPMMSYSTLDGQNQPRVINFADPFQLSHGLQTHGNQNQAGMPTIATKPSSSKGVTHPDRHHQTS